MMIIAARWLFVGMMPLLLACTRPDLAFADGQPRIELVLSRSATGKLLLFARAPVNWLLPQSEHPLLTPGRDGMMLSRYVLEEEPELLAETLTDALPLPGQASAVRQWKIEAEHPTYQFSRPVTALASLGQPSPPVDVRQDRAYVAWAAEGSADASLPLTWQLDARGALIELFDYRADPDALTTRSAIRPDAGGRLSVPGIGQ